MSTQTTDDGSPSPTPTAQRSDGGDPEIPNPRVNRREMLKITGAAAGAATIGAGTASAQTDDNRPEDYDSDFWVNDDTESELGVTASPGNFGAGGAGKYKGRSDTSPYDDVNTDPSGDDAVLHYMSESAIESQLYFESMLGNHLTDFTTMANIEARDGIAKAWKDGLGPAEGYGNALERIRGYHEPLAANFLEGTSVNLLELGFASDVGTNEDDLSQVNWNYTSATYTGSGSNPGVRLTSPAEPEPVTVTLFNGYEYEVSAAPKIRFFTESTADEYEVPWTAMIDAYDETNEEFVFTGPNYEWTADLQFNIPNVPDADLQGQRTFDGVEWIKLYQRFEEQSTTVTQNYDQTLVENIFAKLDAGEISPAEVRGVEGQARYLSGDSEATSDRYRMALMQMLDLQQSDLSQVASMTVSYEGFTDRTFEATDGGRRFKMQGATDGAQTYAGQLFARHTPADGFQTGGKYAAGEYILTDPQSDFESPSLFDPYSGSRVGKLPSQISPETSGADYLVTPDRQSIVVCLGGSEPITMHDLQTGEEVWQNSQLNSSDQLFRAPDGTCIVQNYDGSNDELVKLDLETGNVANRVTTDYGAAELSPDGTELAVSNGNTDIVIYDTSDLSTIETVTTNGTDTDHIDYSPDGSLAAVVDYINGGEAVYVYDTSDWSELWTDSFIEAPDAIHLTNDTLYLAAEYEHYSFEAETGNQNWNLSNQDNCGFMTVTADGQYLLTDNDQGQFERRDPTTGNVEDSFGDSMYFGDQTVHIGLPKETGFDGVVSDAQMFDATTSDEYDFVLGTLTIDEMTTTEGEQISPITDQTITDIENQSGKSLSTIVDGIEEIDTADDVDDLNDLNLILEAEGLDGSQITTESQDWSEPDYDVREAQEYANYVGDVESYLESIGYFDDGGGGDGDAGGGDWWPSAPSLPGVDDVGSQLAGMAVIAVIVVSVVWSVISDAIPFLGN